MKKNGITILEVVIAVTVIGFVLTGIYRLFLVSTTALYGDIRKVEAQYLAQEGIEAVRTLRNTGWNGEIATLVNGLTYYPVLSGDVWTLAINNPGFVNGMYTRTVVLQQVFRDGNDDIALTGTNDPNTRHVTISVSWQEGSQGARSLSLQTYLTNFLMN